MDAWSGLRQRIGNPVERQPKSGMVFGYANRQHRF